MPVAEGEPIRILHVDDEPDVLEFAKTILEVEDLAFDIYDAHTGEEVLMRLHSEYFDCVVSDYRMPGMDGITLAREVRGFSEVPIILYTGQGSEEVASEAYSAGIDDYVRKEVDPSHYRVLAKRIRHIVEKRRSDQIYRGVFEAARDPICIAHGSTIVYANRALAELLGKRDPAELSGRDILDWIAPEDADSIQTNTPHPEKNASRIHEHTFITEKGERRRVESSTSTINYRGKPATLNIQRDITEKKRVEEDLKSNRKLLSMALELTNTGSWTFDIPRRKVSWSEQVDRILGSPPVGEIDLDMIQRFIPPEEWDRMVPKFWRTIDSGRFEEKFKLTRSDGDVRHVVANGEVERNEKGQIVRVFGSLQDITERTRYEEKLKAIYRHAIELSRASTILEVCDSSLKAVKETLGFQTCSFHVVEGDAVMTIGSLGVDMKHPFVQRVQGVGVVPRAVRTGKPQIIQDVTLEPEYEKGPFIGDQQMLSELAVPVHTGGRVVAVINLENPLREAYNEDDGVLMEALAAMIGESIQRLMQLEMLNSLNMHALEISHSKTVEEIAEATVKAVSRVVDFQTGSFTIIEDRRLKPVYAVGFKFSPGFNRTLDDRGIMVRCARTGETQLVHDTRLDPEYVHGFTDDLPQLLSELTVPIKSGDVVTGLINLQCAETNAFSEEDQAKVEMLALYISAALDLIREAKHHREAEEMYRGLLDSTMEGVVVVQGMAYVYVNAEYTRILGYDAPSELIGVNILDTVAPEYRSLVETRTISRQSGESQPSRYSVQLLKRNGARIDAELNIALIEFNGASANLTSVRDMTEQKWMEGEIRSYSARLEKALVERTRSLSESEGKYRALVDNLHEGILTLDAFEHTTFANPRMAEMLGYTVEEMIGRHVTDFIAPDHLDVYLTGTKRRRTSGSEQYDVELVRKDGGIITVTVSTSPLNGENGEYIGSIAGVVDVTEKRRLEAQLRESERQASVGRIASMVGHDLRTPLQTVKNAVALMKRRPKMTEEALKTIDEAVTYSVRILEDLRDVSGCMTPIREEVDLGDLVTEAVTRAPLQNVDVELALGGETVLVSVDPTMMSRVFDNLIKNALEAMPSGGSLKITAGEGDGEVFFEVCDSGVGIAPARMGELFQTFYTTKSNGLGLGLVYCKKAVEAHGGRIEVKSEPGVGSTFRVCLPLGLVRGRLASSIAP